MTMKAIKVAKLSDCMSAKSCHSPEDYNVVFPYHNDLKSYVTDMNIYVGLQVLIIE